MSERINLNGVDFEAEPLRARFGGLEFIPYLESDLDVEPWLKQNPQAVIDAVRRANAITILNSGHLSKVTEHWSPGTKLDTDQIVQWHSDEGEGCMVALVGEGEGTSTSIAKREDVLLAMKANVEFLNPAKVPFSPGLSVQDYLTVVKNLYQDLLSADATKHHAIVNRFNDICIRLARVSRNYADTRDYEHLLSYLNIFAYMVNTTARDHQYVYDHTWFPTGSSTLLMWTGKDYLTGESEIVHRRAREKRPGMLSSYNYKRAVLKSDGSFYSPHWHDLF